MSKKITKLLICVGDLTMKNLGAAKRIRYLESEVDRLHDAAKVNRDRQMKDAAEIDRMKKNLWRCPNEST